MSSKTTKKPLPACPTGKVRNPSTRRCVDAVRWCQAHDGLNPDRYSTNVVGRCRTSLLSAMSRVAGPRKVRFAQAVATPLPCPAGSNRNPETGRCKKRTSKGGGKTARKTARKPQKAARKTARKPAAPKPCAAGKVRNPATGRCAKPKTLRGGGGGTNLRVNWSRAALPRLTRRGASAARK